MDKKTILRNKLTRKHGKYYEKNVLNDLKIDKYHTLGWGQE